MKKLFALILFILSLTGLSVHAEGFFGELTYKADDGLYLFSNGGSGDNDSFGFALSDGVKTIHIYQTGCEFEKPYCAVFKGLPEKELEIRQFVYEKGSFIYDTAIYVVLKNNALSVTTLAEKQEYIISQLEGCADKSLYREAERLLIEEIVSSATQAIKSSSYLSQMNTILVNAKGQIAELKTDAEYYAQELAELKTEEISAISGLLDKTLYREAEQQIIDLVISESTQAINEAATKEEVSDISQKVKAALDAIPTDAKCRENALLNEEVIYYLDKAYDKLDGFRPSSVKGRLIINRIVPVIKIVLDDGIYGRIYITPEYINSEQGYGSDVSYVKEKYGEMAETEKTGFKNEIYDRIKDELVIEFLREYFGL